MAIFFKQILDDYREGRKCRKEREAHEAEIIKLIKEVNAKNSAYVEVKTSAGWDAWECGDPMGTVYSDGELYLYIPPIYEHHPIHYFPIRDVLGIRSA